MKISVFLWSSFAVFASVYGQDGSQVQTAQADLESRTDSQTQGPIDTPKPTLKSLDIADALGPMPTGTSPNRTISPPNHNPRSEPPTQQPTYLPTIAPTTAPTPDPSPWETNTIGHDEVIPFPEPAPVTISEKAGVKFKPQIQIRTGCVPYPAVSATGETSGGLKTSGSPRGGCRGSGHGSQIYGRSTWIDGVWAIMYSWYFPKDSPTSGLGHRHDWEHAVVFIDNPDVPEPKILGCSVSSHNGYRKYNPCPVYVIDGTSLKVRYRHGWPKNHDLDVTGDAGTFQNLIMWDQMTEDARRALNSVSFGSANTPMTDGNFLPKLKEASPF